MLTEDAPAFEWSYVILAVMIPIAILVYYLGNIRAQRSFSAKNLGLKGIQSQTQGDQLRVTGKKRDDLQGVIAALKAEDFGVPLQFNNFRD